MKDVAATSLKLMGEAYPFYTPNGGVPCYVVEAKAKPDWLSNYYAPRIIYWLDRHYFYPLRTENMGRGENLSLWRRDRRNLQTRT